VVKIRGGGPLPDCIDPIDWSEVERLRGDTEVTDTQAVNAFLAHVSRCPKHHALGFGTDIEQKEVQDAPKRRRR